MQAPYPSSKKYGAFLPQKNGRFVLAYALYRYYFVQAAIPYVPEEKVPLLNRWTVKTAKGILAFMADYLLAAALGEARHAWRTSTAFRFPLSLGVRRVLPPKNLHEHNRQGHSRRAWKTCGSTFQLCSERLEKLFLEYAWRGAMGGIRWGHTAWWANQLRIASESTDPIEVVMALEAAINVVHNGAPQFYDTKFPWYSANRLGIVIGMKRVFTPDCYLKQHMYSWTKTALAGVNKALKAFPFPQTYCPTQFRSVVEFDLLTYTQDKSHKVCEICQLVHFNPTICPQTCEECGNHHGVHDNGIQCPPK